MRYLLIALLMIAVSCKSKHRQKEATVALYHPSFNPGPHVIVYKTNGNFNQQVSVTLSDDGNTIVAYPHPNDIKSTLNTVYPTVLKNGYLIDNRGISTQSAFLKYTYDDYAKLDTIPSLNALYDLILSKNSIIEICDCGDKSGYTNLEKQLNDIIEQDSLSVICRKIK